VVRNFLKNPWLVLFLCCVLGAWLVMISFQAHKTDHSQSSIDNINVFALIFFGPFAFLRHPSLWFLLYLTYGILNAFAKYRFLLFCLLMHNVVTLVAVLFPTLLSIVFVHRQISSNQSTSDILFYYTSNCVVYIAVMSLLLFNVFSGIALTNQQEANFGRSK
jgi:hypothetical protein